MGVKAARREAEPCERARRSPADDDQVEQESQQPCYARRAYEKLVALARHVLPNQVREQVNGAFR